MFSISFGEIALIAAVGLIIIGPQRLPQTARFVGHLVSRLQRQAAGIKADIRREMELEDLKSIHQEYQDAATQVQKTFNQQTRELNQAAQSVQDEVNNTAPAKPASDGMPVPPKPPADAVSIAKDRVAATPPQAVSDNSPSPTDPKSS